MAFIVGPETIDTVSVDGNCTYPAAPLGGTPYPTKVVAGGKPL